MFVLCLMQRSYSTRGRLARECADMSVDADATFAASDADATFAASDADATFAASDGLCVRPKQHV